MLWRRTRSSKLQSKETVTAARQMRVLHVITALNFGGAEAMLARLVEEERARRPEVDSFILSLTPPGVLGGRMSAAGFPLDHCGLQGPLTLPRAIARISRQIRASKPHVIVAWMYHAQLAALAAAAIARSKTPIVWNVRHSLHDLSRERRATRAIVRAGALLSRIPRAIIYNSGVAARQYEALGYAPERTIVIPNGFDCRRFRPDEQARSRLVEKMGISPTTLIVGMVARNHPMKDPATLARAVLCARAQGADIHLLLVGSGMTTPSDDLAQILGEFPRGHVTVHEHEPAIARLLPAIDVVALSSAWGEGFPNILGEAMASGVPCVATDVGDSRLVVGDTGIIVPPGDSQAMATALARMARMTAGDRRMLGNAARERIETHFSIHQVTSRYHQLFEQVAGRATGLRRMSETPTGAALSG